MDDEDEKNGVIIQIKKYYGLIIIINCTFASQTQSYSRQLRLCHSTAYIIHCCYVTKTSYIIQLSSYKRLFKK